MSNAIMGKAIKLPDDLIDAATVNAAAQSRSVPRQIEYWARIGKIADENPDLSFQFVKDVLIGQQEYEAGDVSEYRFG